jgi:hypothetical protein
VTLAVILAAPGCSTRSPHGDGHLADALQLARENAVAHAVGDRIDVP